MDVNKIPNERLNIVDYAKTKDCDINAPTVIGNIMGITLYKFEVIPKNDDSKLFEMKSIYLKRSNIKKNTNKTIHSDNIRTGFKHSRESDKLDRIDWIIYHGEIYFSLNLIKIIKNETNIEFKNFDFDDFLKKCEDFEISETIKKVQNQFGINNEDNINDAEGSITEDSDVIENDMPVQIDNSFETSAEIKQENKCLEKVDPVNLDSIVESFEAEYGFNQSKSKEIVQFVTDKIEVEKEEDFRLKYESIIKELKSVGNSLMKLSLLTLPDMFKHLDYKISKFANSASRGLYERIRDIAKQRKDEDLNNANNTKYCSNFLNFGFKIASGIVMFDQENFNSLGISKDLENYILTMFFLKGIYHEKAIYSYKDENNCYVKEPYFPNLLKDKTVCKSLINNCLSMSFNDSFLFDIESIKKLLFNICYIKVLQEYRSPKYKFDENYEFLNMEWF